MTLLDEVCADRADLARVLKKHAGIRRTVEDLYPDSAHFIYELLQNAEDVGAKEAHFTLRRDALVFEHDGRPFDDSDVWAITDIGEGTKAGSDDKIGRFGLGFKAVFAYTETPRIWSPTYSFEIRELVLPYEVTPIGNLGHRTRFEFPFNNPKKSQSEAYSEVLFGLNELAATTLLFLRSLELVAWCIEGVESEVLRVEHDMHHVEILHQIAGATTSSSHYLRFQLPVREMENQRVALAYELALASETPRFDPASSIGAQMRIVPANPGRVAVFFPAEKETSGLRFHLHAPFVPELSRASIKDTPANVPLIAQLAELVSASLPEVRDGGLLTADFLGVLPNSQDGLPKRYEAIREAIVSAMNHEPLVPTNERLFAPANSLLQGPALLKDLLGAEELRVLGATEGRHAWAISATQRNSNADRFLAGLNLARWDADELVAALADRCGTTFRRRRDGTYSAAPDQQFLNWLHTRPEAWLQQLYASLQELVGSSRLSSLSSLQLVRRSDGSHGTGETTFFPSPGVDRLDLLPRVAEATYTSGRSKQQHEAARKFLEVIGVREVSESDEVAAVLEQRYRAAATEPLEGDLLRFVTLVEADPSTAEQFADYYIFENVDGKWATPSMVYLDDPVRRTGLDAYFNGLGDASTLRPLAAHYERLSFLERFGAFCEAVGVATTLDAVEVSCDNNPERRYLESVGGERYTASYVSRDFQIPGLSSLLDSPTLALSRLIWATMNSTEPRKLRACFQRNQRNGAHFADSQLVHTVRSGEWVPQTDGTFRRPVDAIRENLPPDYAYDPAQKWLSAVQFGQSHSRTTAREAEQAALAISLGLPTGDALERAKRFANLPLEQQHNILAAIERQSDSAFPVREPGIPHRRAQRVEDLAKVAPERATEIRSRSVSIGTVDVRQQARAYLTDQYTNDDEEMFCQVCKAPMPFRLEDGTWYFECVEFLPDLGLRHYQNYLALCPNHAAMFQHANRSRPLLFDLLVSAAELEIQTEIGRQDSSIRFTSVHLADLRIVARTDPSRH